MSDVLGPNDRFEPVRSLGKGNMGEVWLARDRKRGCLVAMKTVGECDDLALSDAKLRREGDALKALDHEGIVKHFATLKVNGRYFIVQEYVDGITLRQWLNRLAAGRIVGLDPESLAEAVAPEDLTDEPAFLELDDIDESPGAERAESLPLPPEVVAHVKSDAHIRTVCELVKQAAEALGHAHAREVWHRDLKPENIMIDRRGRIKIIDFGIARREGDATLSQTGAILGSPLYMSPEHITGRVNVTVKSDVFSLGIVLYEALALHCPYTARTPLGLFQQIATRPAPPVGGANPGVPKDLEAVVHKAITKDPDSRYPDGSAFAEDLGRFLDGKPVKARPYRYRPDRREIAVERPFRISVAASLWFFIAGVAFLAIFAYWTMPREAPVDRYDFLTMGFFAAVGIPAFAIGKGLLQANRLATWTAPIAALIFAFVAFKAAYDTPNDPRGSAFVMIMYLLMGAMCLYIAYAVLSRKARRWYAFAREIKAEQSGKSTPLARS